MPQDARDLKGKTGIRRLINATRYSRDGFAKLQAILSIFSP